MMRLSRPMALTLLAAFTLGSLLTTSGYAWYLRSDAYRNYCARILSESLGLPAEIGGVVPRSRDSRGFAGVRVYLPQRRGEAAVCHEAILTYTPQDDDPDAYELTLRGGYCEISARTWLRDDYRTVVESGLLPGFDPDGPRRVIFSGMRLLFKRDQFQISLDDAAGVVDFSSQQIGRASVTCDNFNGHTTDEPITLGVEFSPRVDGLRMDRVELTVPQLPASLLGMEDLAGLRLETGSFGGRLIYRETDFGRETSLRGTIRDLQLAECTAAFFERPWSGAATEVELRELRIMNRRFERASFRGLFTDVELGDMLALRGLGGIGGKMLLRVREAIIDESGVQSLVASGRCSGIDLRHVSEAVGWGMMTGRAHVVIDDLTIVSNHLKSLDGRIVVREPVDAPDWIERDLLLTALDNTLGVRLPQMMVDRLPERFEYARLGVRFEVRDERLWIFGTHGPREQTILTIHLAGQELPIVSEPREAIDLKPLLDDVRARAASEIRRRIETLLNDSDVTLPGRKDPPE